MGRGWYCLEDFNYQVFGLVMRPYISKGSQLSSVRELLAHTEHNRRGCENNSKLK